MASVENLRNDMEHIENSIKASLECEQDFADTEQQVKGVKVTRGKGKKGDKDSEVQFEETMINIKDCFKMFKPIMQNAIMTATKEIIERQQVIEVSLRGEIAGLNDQIKTLKKNANNQIIDSKIRDDALEQYNRRDSIRIYGIPQSEAEKTNSRITLNKVLDTMKKIDLEDQVKEDKISTCHRIHRRNKDSSRPDPIIVKLVARHSKDLIMGNASKLKNGSNQQIQFINEDLTPLRSRLVNFIKTKVPSVISKSVHTRDGRILCKQTEDQSKWTYIESVRDLSKVNVNMSQELLKELGMDTCLIADMEA